MLLLFNVGSLSLCPSFSHHPWVQWEKSSGILLVFPWSLDQFSHHAPLRQGADPPSGSLPFSQQSDWFKIFDFFLKHFTPFSLIPPMSPEPRLPPENKKKVFLKSWVDFRRYVCQSPSSNQLVGATSCRSLCPACCLSSAHILLLTFFLKKIFFEVQKAISTQNKFIDFWFFNFH